MQAAGPLIHDIQAVVFALVAAGVVVAAEAAAIVLDRQAQGFAVLAQLQPDIFRVGVAQAVGKRLAGDLQQVDLLAGRQLESQAVELQVHLEIAATGELLGGRFELAHQPGIVDLQAEGGQQFAQLAVGIVHPFAQFGGDVLQGAHRFATAHQGLHAADLQLHVGQGLGQGVVELAGDDRALLEQQQAMVLFALALERQRGADQVGQGLDQFGFPGLRGMVVEEVRLELAQFAALVADAEALPADGLVALAAGAIADRADVPAAGAMQGDQLLRRGLQLALQAQRQAQPRQALLEAPDQLVQAFGVGQPRGQAAAALIQQLEGGIGLLQVVGLLPHQGFQGAVGLLDGLGHGVEAGGQLAQFVLGLVVDPHLELAATKTLGGLHQFLQRRDHAVLQLVQAQQQDEQGGEQRRALDQLLPGLLMFALALQQADELVQLFDEGQGQGLERRGVVPFQGRLQFVVPALLDLPVAAQQVGVGAVFQHGPERLAVEALLQALADTLDVFGAGAGGQLPAQVVGLHAHRARGIDGRRVALAEPGDQPGAQGTGQRQHGDQDHRQAGAGGQGAAQPADHGRGPQLSRLRMKERRAGMESSRGGWRWFCRRSLALYL